MIELKRIRVGIVEDDGILREALSDALEVDPSMEMCGAYASAEDFLDQLMHTSPDVVIMDLNLPGINGIECTRRAKELRPLLQVLVCTVQDDDDSLFNALCAGATGYLLKDARPNEVVHAVKTLSGGGSPMSPGIARRVLASFSAPRKQVKEMELLSEREREVLEQLAKGHRYKEIADGLNLSIETVRTHIRNLYDKLQVSSRTDALNKLYPR
ncbi:MAG: response regulator transcription factor [Flavobacteriales bacterium]|nr:response regulator transcription factor [Flavobacteriales bacterium]